MNPITDINVFLGNPDAGARFRTAEELLPWMDLYQIEQVVAFHAYAAVLPKEGNRLIAEQSKLIGKRISPCFLLDPLLMEESLPGKGSFETRMRELNPAAVRLNLDSQELFNEFYCGDILAELNQLSLPLMIDTPTDRFLNALPHLSASYPNISFVLLHFGFRRSLAVDALLKQRSNIYFDISLFADAESLPYFIKKYGSLRFLFGSGMPTYTPENLLGMIAYSALTPTHQKNILSGNWHRIAGISN